MIYSKPILKTTTELLPNATIKEVLGCHSVTDMNGEVIGFIDGYFYLNEEYKHAQQIYERFLTTGIQIKTYKDE